MRKLTIWFGALLFACLLTAECGIAATGVIVALNTSIDHIKKQFDTPTVFKAAGRTFFSGKVQGHPFVVVRSPMGKVNNAITAQALLANPEVDTVFSIAPAGAVDSALNIGDTVIASNIRQHDFGTIKPYGFIWNGVPEGMDRTTSGYHASNKKLRKRFLEMNRPAFEGTVSEGTIVSGDQFIASEKKKAWLARKFHALCVDTGAAAIAQTCHANKIQYLIVRIITDKAEINARENFSATIRDNTEAWHAIIDCLLNMAMAVPPQSPPDF
ncbi:MAG: 5'-methylthioadenosine/S-adenosylhomocysteine nucleosidase [Thermodesulfobacteriota bacterium]|nr:5'-methylthioadenosine/S-adenosylhomocysteine nucleosidase [Thermodesulfobacteriota bacterium]